MSFFHLLPARDGACPMTVASRPSVHSLLISSGTDDNVTVSP